jgi:hypothetical protein
MVMAVVGVDVDEVMPMLMDVLKGRRRRVRKDGSAAMDRFVWLLVLTAESGQLL